MRKRTEHPSGHSYSAIDLWISKEALIASVDRMMEKQPENMYLTHFGRVQEVNRLASEMKDGVRKFAALGEQFRGHENRLESIQSEMMGWLVTRAREHGVRLSDQSLRDIFTGDVILNSQGIDFWLDHGRNRS